MVSPWPAERVAESSQLPYQLHLELTVEDPETIRELFGYPEGEGRDALALKALRIGVLALQQARGQIDQDTVRREGERLLSGLQGQLDSHARLINDRVSQTLKDYFDPQSGRFEERVNRLIQQDGELEQVLRRQVGQQDSELCRTLARHFGDDSPLMKLLTPDQSQGVLYALRITLAEQLTQQRELVLGQFSLDNREGALSRFIAELHQQHGRLSESWNERINELMREFSLDAEDSALSRLVRNVDRAQRTITSEFSLDEDGSALSRLKGLLEQTNAAIEGHLSLDDDQSALARLKRELLTLLKESSETNQRFQEEVKSTLRAMQARREEAARSTRHGVEFEDALFEMLQRYAQDGGDIAQRTSNSTGRIRNCKIGDCIVQLGPDCAAAAAVIVIEAKEKAGYDLGAAREEIELARKNRGAQIGLFVFSKKTAPVGLDPLTRYGRDVFIVWDAEDPQTDLFLRVGITLARALCVRRREQQTTEQADLEALDHAILEIEKKVSGLSDIETWTQTIQKRSEDILKRVRTTRESLDKQAAILQQTMDQLRHTLAETMPE